MGDQVERRSEHDRDGKTQFVTTAYGGGGVGGTENVGCGWAQSPIVAEPERNTTSKPGSRRAGSRPREGLLRQETEMRPIYPLS